MFKSAAEAFKSGNLQEAKKLSSIGNDYKKKFYELKQINGDKMFKSLNSEQSLEDKIDLHGLHSNEALSFLSLQVDKLKQQIRDGILIPSKRFKVITGFGHGSKDGISKLKPIVEKYFITKDIRYQIAPDGGSYDIWFN